MQKLLRLLFCGLWVFVNQAVHSEIQIDKYYFSENKSISGKKEIADDTSLDNREVIRRVENLNFTPFYSDLLKGFTDDTQWIKLVISDKKSVTDDFSEKMVYPLILRVGALTLDKIQLFEFNKNEWTTQMLGDRHMSYPRLCDDEFHCFYLKSTLEKPITLYLKIESQNIVQIHAEVVAQDELSKVVSKRIRASSISIAVGICLFVVALIFYLIDRSRLILVYVFFQISLTLYTVSFNGILFDFFKGDYFELIKFMPELFFYFRSLLFCLLCREIFISYSVNRFYKRAIIAIVFLIITNMVATFADVGHLNNIFNIALQLCVLGMNYYALITTVIPSKISKIIWIGNTVYSLILTSGFLYVSNLIDVNNFNFLIHDFFDYRLNGIAIGCVIFSIVAFEILEKNKKNQTLLNEAASSKLTVTLLNEKLHEREQMVDLLTHEIKNPLSTINYAAAFIQNNHALESEVNERTKKIVQSTNRINTVLNQVFLSAKLDQYSSKEHEQNESINFTELVKDIVSDYESGRIFKINNREVVEIFGNRFLLTTVLDNLISNAVKYRSQNSEINISFGVVSTSQDSKADGVEVTGGFYFFNITNTVDINNIPDPDQLFKRYYRHDNFISKPGMGIGLNIVQVASNLIGGQISWCLDDDLISFKLKVDL